MFPLVCLTSRRSDLLEEGLKEKRLDHAPSDRSVEGKA